MTLRWRIRWGLAGLFALAMFAVALGQWSRSVRTEASNALVEALTTERAVAATNSCLTKLQREVTLLAGSVGGEAAGGLDAELTHSVLDEIARCEAAWREARVGVISKIPEAEIPSTILPLLDDWRYVVPRLGKQQVEATTRLATRADPAAETLLGEEVPKLQRMYVERTRESVAAAHATAGRADLVLSATLALTVILLTVGALLLLRRLSLGLGALIDGTEAFGRGDLQHRVPAEGRDELALAARAINDMAGRLALANELLQQRAGELEQSLQTLQGAQKALVQQEKMAALGGLVAGVAHEVNTPIGVALTSGTMVQEQLVTLTGHVEAGTATKGIVRRSLSDAHEGLELMVANLRRAADLIQSFKQVAVDRDQPAVRKTWLHEWTHEVVQSLSPLAKRHRVKVATVLPETCQLDLAAGELQQVLTNLLINSLVHGLAPPDPEDTFVLPAEPMVTVAVHLEADRLHLLIGDNGRGMAAEVALRVFEPFFTTRRGQGGSGLGMHIVYSLVTERFGGTIAVDTAPGEGCRWHVYLPFDSQALRRTSAPMATECV